MFYRRKLRHLQRDNKRHFVTFCTFQRWILPESAGSIVLGCCLHDNDQKHFLHAAVVMPDHVHLIFTPLICAEKREFYSLAEIMGAIKGASAPAY
jgi:REP element-mobilizing transposase RayT